MLLTFFFNKLFAHLVFVITKRLNLLSTGSITGKIDALNNRAKRNEQVHYSVSVKIPI